MLYSLKLAWRASPFLTVATFVLAIVSGLMPVAFTIATGMVVGAVPGAVRDGMSSAAGQHLVRSLVALTVTYLLQTTTSNFTSVVTGSLGSRFTLTLRNTLFAETLGPAGIAHLEDPKVADELRMIAGDDHRWYTEQLMFNIAVQLRTKITGVGSAILLGTVLWWAPFALIPAIFFFYLWLLREIETVVAAYEGGTAELRRAQYLRDVAVRPEAAKELRIFGFGNWIVDWYATTWRQAMEPQWRARRGHATPLLITVFTELAAGLAIFASIGSAALSGKMTIGALAVAVGAFQNAHSLGPQGDSDPAMLRGLKIVKRLRNLPAITRTPHADLRGDRSVEHAGEVRFENVTFGYPSTTSVVLDGLDLTVPRGKSLAIVGLNGAGKTTLMKLLARLYDPQDGRITSDGIDISEIDPPSWRRRIGVIFQDFVRFEMDAAANVGFGAPHEMQDVDALDRAATKAGADRIIASLDQGWSTVLSRGYEQGTDLSGGQWQRIALARALMALEGGADILVLDEPTANLDVRAEAELFDRFLEITAGATTILISHRFSTVRRADRIAVVEHGRVVEEGSHDELIATGGRYSRLFGLQAERFTQDAEAADA